MRAEERNVIVLILQGLRNGTLSDGEASRRLIQLGQGQGQQNTAGGGTHL